MTASKTNITTTNTITSNTIVVSHKNCSDGTFAAFLVWLANGCEMDKAKFQVHYHNHGEELPEFVCQKLVVTDLAFSKEDYANMDGVGSIVMLDHHKTAISKFGHVCGLEKCVVGGKFLTSLVDMSECGSMLTYKYFKEDIAETLSRVFTNIDGNIELLPKEEFFCNWEENTAIDHMLSLINDRDMWLKKHGDDTEVNHLWMVQNGIRNKDDWQSSFKSILEMVLDIDDHYSNQIYPIRLQLEFKRDLVRGYEKKFSIVTFDGIPNVALSNNGGLFTSEVGELLYELDSDERPVSFAMIYSVGQNEVYVGLRGKKPEEFDLSKIATKYGGGGHPNSSGFKMPVSEFFRLIQW